ncbi:DUF5076 domain-containing protein [Prosthecobacter debontii]|uniref:DUF5076 domain-containing protein n=1 Tax=Prosthecobacter debontii TaxID=48467 RepID=UPI00099AFD9A|nr:DUF5076 domain-containing protein [Prosthecobacter debontii]
MNNHTSSGNELPTPNVPIDSQSMELLRIWLINGAPCFVITQNLWNDPSAWGLLLADVMRHLGNAYERDGQDRSAVLGRIKEVFDAEWDEPSSSAEPIE